METLEVKGEIKEKLRKFEQFFHIFSLKSCYDTYAKKEKFNKQGKFMKKSRKQWLIFGIVALLMLGGCAKEQPEPVVEETPEEVTEEIVEEVIETPAEEPEKEEAVVRVNVDRKQKTYYLADTDKEYLYLEYCDVTVETSENQNLKKNIENWSMDRSEGLRSMHTEFEESAMIEAENNENFWGYSLYQTVSVSRVDGQVVSLLDDNYQHTGGAHGMFYREGVNFDVKTGKRLNLQEILSDYTNFSEEATGRIITYLQENYGEELFDDYIQTVESLWQEDLGPEWYMDGSGIVIVLQQYEVGPAVIGAPEVHIPYAEVGQYIKEAYLPKETDGVAKIEKNQEIYLKLPNKTEEVPMMLQYEEKDEIPTVTLWVGDKKRSLDSFAVLTNAYLVRTQDEVFCLVEGDFASDDYVTYVYRITDGLIDQVAQIYGAIDAGNINTNGILMKFWVDFLGTYGGVKKYYFDENLEFVTADTEYRLHNNEFVLTTKVDLPVTLEGSESILPAGSHIILNATDGESYAAFTIQETGQSGVLSVERDANDYYSVSVNGMNEQECFEFLPYAG